MALSNYLRIREDYIYNGSKANFDINGAASTAYTITVTGPTGATIDTFTMTTDSNGIATTERSVSWGTVVGTYIGKVTIGATEYSDNMTYSYKEVLINHGLSTLFDLFQNLEVRDEIGVLNSDRSQARFTYKNWQRKYTPQFFKNDNTFLTLWTDIDVDHEAGIAYPGTTVQGDEISAQYRFKYFTDGYWGDILDLAITMGNALKPHTSYSINEAPAEWDDLLVMYSYIKSLEKLLLDLNLWRTRLIFPDPAVMYNTLTNLLAAARAEIIEIKKQTKRRGDTSPRIVTSYKQSVPRSINGVNWRSYSILGTFSADGS